MVVYQNADFVSGLLQSLMNSGLVESIETDEQLRARRSRGADTTVGGGLRGEMKFPFPMSPSAGLSAEASRVSKNAREDEATRAHRLRYVFSQAYYLKQVRDILDERGLITKFTAEMGHEHVRVGEFVEFGVKRFQAAEIPAVLDIATADLVSAVTRYVALKETREIMRAMDVSDLNALTVTRERGVIEAEDRSALAGAIAEALQRDFRASGTKQYYGIIADPSPEPDDDIGTGSDWADEEADLDGEDASGLTAITVCESAHFLTADPDRLLDGQFTVLAKVIEPPRVDVPVLGRNKLLDRIDGEFLEQLLGRMGDTAETTSSGLAGTGYEGTGIDLSFSAYVPGRAFSVLPVAIYA